MSDLVNSTHKSQLSPKNSEASHLKGGSYDVLGGPTWDNKGGDEPYKINASKGVTPDSTIPKSVGPEGTHLPQKQEDVDVEFDGDKKDVDDLDKELDAFEEVEPVDVDIEVDDDDDDDDKKKKVDEDENPFAKKDGDDDKEKDDDDDKEEGGKKKWNFQKEDAEPELSDSAIKAAARDAELPIKEEDGDDDDDDKKDDDEKLEEEDDEMPDFIKKKIDAKKDDKEDEPKSESVKVRIKLPSAKLFESVNMSSKTQKKVAVVFEQAIRATTKQVANQLHAHYKKLHEARLAERDTVMAKQMDAYLNYVTEEWMKSNRVAVRKTLRTQLAEEFLNGLQQLFKEHYIAVPDSKVDVVEQLTAQNATLKASLNEQHAQKLKLRRLAEQANKARIIAEFGRGMSEASTVKLHKLAEDTQYTSAKDFREKLSMLKESYFPKGRPSLKTLPEEDVQEEKAPKSKRLSSDPDVNAIAQALSRQADASKW